MIEGDFDGDGFVDFVDFSWLAKLWLQPNCNWCGGFDFDLDLDIDLIDLQVFGGLWLQ